MKYIDDFLLLGNANFFYELYLFMFVTFMWCQKRDHFWIKAILLGACGSLFYFMPSLHAGSFSFVFLLVFTYFVICAMLLYKTNWFGLLILTSGAWAMQHMAWNLLLLFFDEILADVDLVNPLPLVLYLLFYAITFVGFGVLFYRRKDMLKFDRFDLKTLIGSLILLVTSVFLSYYVAQWNWATRLYSVCITVVCILIDIGFFDKTKYEFEKAQIENDNNALKMMINEQAKLYEIHRQNYDLLNAKIHDVKHQIKVIKSLGPEAQKAYLSDLEKVIDIYGNSAKTGNSILDVILNEKSLYCYSKNIPFTYICDGKAVDVLKAEDLMPLFGNLIDNAIEAASKEKEEDRFIKLTAMNKKNFLCIHIENCCTGKVNFAGALPSTTKGDINEHGYGSKSIQFIVNKYHGTFEFKKIDDVFSVNISIPLTPEKS